jgi:hypothetical protein
MTQARAMGSSACDRRRTRLAWENAYRALHSKQRGTDNREALRFWLAVGFRAVAELGVIVTRRNL